MKNFMNYQTNNTAYAKSKKINGSFVEHGLANGKRYQTEAVHENEYSVVNENDSKRYRPDSNASRHSSSGYASSNSYHPRQTEMSSKMSLNTLNHSNCSVELSPVGSSIFIGSKSHHQPNFKPQSKPFCPNQTALMQICNQYHSITAKAQYCFLELFTEEIETGVILTGKYNVYGRAPKGSAQSMKPLNETKINYLKKFLTDKFETGNCYFNFLLRLLIHFILG
jgi:hypothetical protein